MSVVFGQVKVLSEKKERKNFSTMFGESTMSVWFLDNSSWERTSLSEMLASFAPTTWRLYDCGI
jgi:hypothetical protein